MNNGVGVNTVPLISTSKGIENPLIVIFYTTSSKTYSVLARKYIAWPLFTSSAVILCLFYIKLCRLKTDTILFFFVVIKICDFFVNAFFLIRQK